jgi:molybdopterin/thiamine biosynthesis adenylyltransferase
MLDRSDLDQKYLNTVFDRQARITQWNQDSLAQQTVLVLGLGGLGSVVLMSILRLGVKKAIVVDYDVVEQHNLNRQILYTVEDVGKAKVDRAVHNSKFHNIGGTEVVGYSFDAVANWSRVVELARQSSVVFNCIDYGDKYDIAVASLCMALNLPLIQGGTFSTMFTIDFVNPKGRPCFLCLGD